MVAENQMTKLRKFVDDYSTQLHQIEEALDESLVIIAFIFFLQNSRELISRFLYF